MWDAATSIHVIPLQVGTTLCSGFLVTEGSHPACNIMGPPFYTAYGSKKSEIEHQLILNFATLQLGLPVVWKLLRHAMFPGNDLQMGTNVTGDRSRLASKQHDNQRKIVVGRQNNRSSLSLVMEIELCTPNKIHPLQHRTHIFRNLQNVWVSLEVDGEKTSGNGKKSDNWRATLSTLENQLRANLCQN